MKKLLSTILATCLIFSATACGTAGADNREIADNRETMSTVNPDISEPNQSIASGALIPEQTTKTTTETQNSGNTYNLVGKDFTLSVHLEDYIYNMDGSDYEYFNLEELMNHYGYANKTNAPYLCYRDCYGNDSLSISFDRGYTDGVNEASGHEVSGIIFFTFKGAYDGYRGVRSLHGAGNCDRLFEINGTVKDGKAISKWCLSWEQLVLLCVVLDDYAVSGTTQNAYDQIEKVYRIAGMGEVVLNW